VRTHLLGSRFFGLIGRLKSLGRFESSTELDEFVNCVHDQVKALQNHSLLPCGRHIKFGDIQEIVLIGPASHEWQKFIKQLIDLD